MSDTPRLAPYPADTRAKGWRFELDYETIDQSDTWDIANEVPLAQHCLLLMWYVAWKQVPCGSLPADDATLRVKCKVPAKIWPTLRPVLLRGWWLADDGRLYHDTLTSRVMEMLEYRRKTADRVAKHKASKREQHAGNALPTGEHDAKNDTGTGTGTIGEEPIGSPPPAGDWEGDELPAVVTTTSAGMLCRTLKRAGFASVSPSHPGLLALLDAGAQEGEFIAFAEQALTKNDPFPYLLTVVQSQRVKAAQVASQMHRGELPPSETAYQRSMRERMEQASPSIAAKRPGAQRAPNPMEVLDGLVRITG